MKRLIIFLGLSMIFWSCEKADKLEGDEYLIFGKYNGYCPSNCTTLYKIEKGELYADNIDRYIPGENITFESDPLSNEKYIVAEKAYQDFPTKLNETTETSFGCPGCVDQDIILLKFFDGADIREWQVDSDIEYLPEYLQDYTIKLKETIENLDQ